MARWSASEGEEVPSGGIVGSAILDLRQEQSLFDHLWVGQGTGVGKSTLKGLGSYRVEMLG
ncbi:MAG: hypothetical protein ACSHXI_06250 [Hoeflea sp.]|uniref:hypothetical protein n=1 Tax=Hoeflea sp. TaxID=1940281 RepID=UPI003EF7B617